MSGGSLTSGNMDLRAPSGRALTFGGWIRGETLSEDVPETGTYRFIIDPRQRETGTVDVLLRHVPADHTGTLTIGGAARTLTFAPFQAATLAYEGTAGQPTNVVISGSTLPEVSVSVSMPDLVDAAGDIVTGPSGTLPIPAPQSGTYRMRLDPSPNDTSGSLTVRVVRAPSG
jgi:hypothetical protein